mmetsp:Transcript_112320/g.210631  ORF Transcript_112320/g.210631 Transcript_112320/m.210631 type:complete len:88 (+) Transcript_112320:60-323(+)
MRFTPPRRAKRRMAGFVMPWMLSRSTFLVRVLPPLPKTWGLLCPPETVRLSVTEALEDDDMVCAESRSGYSSEKQAELGTKLEPKRP